jgi:hypothetical protein
MNVATKRVAVASFCQMGPGKRIQLIFSSSRRPDGPQQDINVTSHCKNRACWGEAREEDLTEQVGLRRSWRQQLGITPRSLWTEETRNW